MGIAKLIKEVREYGDFEFYPTLESDIALIKNHIDSLRFDMAYSILDIGVGDGRVLNALAHKHGEKYAMEKSLPLIRALPADIMIVGTDFMAQTLVDIDCNIIFNNPPFSQYAEFACKIIAESLAPDVYLILPSRWKNNASISEALERRNATYTILGSSDYSAADRAARCTVDVIHISLSQYRSYARGRATVDVDPFATWFADNFNIDAIGSAARKAASLKTKVKEENFEIVAGGDLISTLVNHYDASLEKLIETYKGLERVDGCILDELNVSIDSIYAAIKLRIKSLKNKYWKELFSRFSPITDKLCSATREDMQTLLMKNVNVDFTRENAYAIAEWAIKNVNKYIDSQLISVYESLIGECNITLYKSNQRTFSKSEWQYNRKPSGLDRFALDYRIVTSSYSNFGGYSFERVNGFSKSSASKIDDLITIAHNLGFDTAGMERSSTVEEWQPGKLRTFHYYDHTADKKVVLFTARPYLNGNIHFKFNQAYIARLNVEFGRLKGWISTPAEAKDEISGVDLDCAKQAFRSNYKVNNNAMKLLSSIN
ncbi:DUF4942 domain-containing protein [Pseudoalteromonas sp. Angola-7]|jgi:hypothetical protein|uniref:DUF4942 domain-containing protein n=1 Tax=Pseudoalteromonas sp. Angola-7 TaxID=3025336 RepID=UPI0023598506|nr:DUF4942 domain-containing protein [Pseudoalteromonas sp. Angola-7]MDC9530262.1 DUF4942 domain-containing protein [Pseudoalteromonas sp. Angola-7]